MTVFFQHFEWECNMRQIVLGLTSLIIVASLANAQEPQIRIVLVGDSTMASYTRPPKDRPDLTGWGQVFGEIFNKQVSILNHAQSGRSSRSFINEGRWKIALAARPSHVFIQFGHNDQPGRKGRSTDADSTYQEFLRQ